MKKLSSLLGNLDYFIQPILMIILLAAALLQVLYRFVPFVHTPWTLELITYLFSASVWLGISIAVKENSHVGILAVYSRFPRKIRIFFKICNYGIFAAMMLVFAFLGLQALVGYWRTENISPALHAPYWLLRSPIAIGGIYSVYRIVQQIAAIIRHTDPEFFDTQSKPVDPSVYCDQVGGIE
ncbi:TRAP transporter small permease [Sediminispirochaeta bajacaliforniensis]|uniref:TRAP transporter small permease n=1 Tax=Sediminispirochaeta bajacaliforniensis TaxID=148 RepID=UPI00037EAE22|nr:TRAP transporter small permease [Sediminispirochaeta bajacaliforniensis]